MGQMPAREDEEEISYSTRKKVDFLALLWRWSVDYPFGLPTIRPHGCFWAVAGRGGRTYNQTQEPMNKTLRRPATIAMLIAIGFLLTSCVIVTRDAPVRDAEATVSPMSASALGTNGPPIIVPGTIILGGGSKPNCPGPFTAAVTFK